MSGDSSVEKRVRVQHPGGGESKTVQSDALKSDINAIMSKYINPPPVVPLDGSHASYGDFSSGIDYHEAMTKVVQADERFLRLPLAVRRHCNHNAGDFLDMVYNPERRHELEELGLVEKQAPQDAPAAQKPQEAVEPVAESSQPK